ncbi:MAG: serine/threonine transporter SstT [Bacteroidaceae bacterium]|nr:serine/threonine transporter SstT [Bacteroidaceae bacterium]
MKKLLQSVATKWQELSLLLRIFIGLVIGAVLGLTCPQLTGISILGQLFVSALKAVAPVLVAVLVAASIAKAQGGLGSRFRTVIVLYMVSTMCAAFTAVAGSFLFPVEISLADAVNDEAPSGLVNIFTGIATNMVANPIQAIANANYIGVLFWAIVVGFALKLRASEATIKVVDDFSETISLVVKWVIQFAPFGILGLVFTSVSESGMDIFITYGKLVALLVGCMLFSCLILNPLIVALCIRKNPYPLVLTCLKESGINAFFTRSSAANIPINMALCKRLGINEDFYSVSIPLGATINMNGAAVTITVMTLAVCHTLGLQVDLVSALFLSVLAALGACGTSGVAGGSLLLIPMACSLFGISNGVAMQAVGVGFIISVIQDSLETAINSSGDAIFTATADMIDKNKA